MGIWAAYHLDTELVLLLSPKLFDTSLLNINTLYLLPTPKLLVCSLSFLSQKGFEAVHIFRAREPGYDNALGLIAQTCKRSGPTPVPRQWQRLATPQRDQVFAVRWEFMVKRTRKRKGVGVHRRLHDNISQLVFLLFFACTQPDHDVIIACKVFCCHEISKACPLLENWLYIAIPPYSQTVARFLSI